jgi:hypothetical protein
MNEKTMITHQFENDPEAMNYRMRQGPKTAAFLIVIPGCATVGYGVGMLASRPLPCIVIGLGVE